jgi:3',5'-cyclic-AMP phosphodiesterase
VTAARHTLVQVSDLHLDAAAPLYERVDTVGRLRDTLAVIEAMHPRPEAILLTGDLANHATPEDYRTIRGLLDPVVARLGVPLVVIPGNHDVTATLREHLLGDTATTGPMDRVLMLGGLRVIALDTTIEGRHTGELTDAQLDRLAAELADPAPEGTLLAVHHPPLPSPIALFEHVALEAPERLAAALAGTDVRLVLAGHAHHTACGTVAGIPVWIAPATAYTADVTAPEDRYRGIAGATGITRIDVFDDTVVTTLVPVGDRAPVVDLAVADVLEQL